MKHFEIVLFILLISFSSSNLLSRQNSKNFSPSIVQSLDEKIATYLKEGEIARQNGDFQKALELYEKEFIEAKKENNKNREVKSLIKKALLNWNLGQLDISKNNYIEALEISKRENFRDLHETCRTILEIFNLYADGKKFRSSGEYNQSIESFIIAISLAKKLDSKEHELKCLRQLSYTYLEINSLQEFATQNENALKIAQNLNHKIEEERALINLGLFYQKLDNYYKALNYYEEALQIARSTNQKADESACLNNIGTIYKNIGEYEDSLNYLFKAFEIDKEMDIDIYMAMDLNNIGTVYWFMGMESNKNSYLDRALFYYGDALRLAKKAGHKKTEIKILNNIASVHSQLKEYNTADEHYKSALIEAENIKDFEAMGMILNNLGIIYYNQGNYEESNKYYQRAIDLALEFPGGAILWEAYLERAKTLEKQNNLSAAVDSYKNSIQIIEDIRSQLKLEEHKASFLGTDKRIQAYQNLIQLLATLHESHPDKNYGQEAFNYLERGKARVFLDSLEISKVDIFQGLDSKLQNQEKDIMRNISNVYNKLLAAELSPEEKTNIYEQLKNYEHELEMLKREIRSKSPAYADLKYPKIVSLNEAQKLLNKNTAFFAYSLGEDKSHAFVVTKKDFKTFPIPSKTDLKELVADYMKIITDKNSNDFGLGYKLYSSLILPGLTKKIKRIIFIPDDILHFLPFETLNTDQNSASWLLNTIEIAYTPSITSLQKIIEKKKTNGSRRPMDIIAIGDPDFGSFENGDDKSTNFRDFFSTNTFSFDRLEYSGTEVNKVSSLFKAKKTHTLLRERASEDLLKKQNLTDYKIIHFATHSVIDNKNPVRSSILLSLDDDPQEDGLLQMREIYNLSLNSDLVTLSSCQTGLGQLIKGEGIEGINRAFFYAGASSVLMSLWPVNDQATYQLMERFYMHLRSSESIAGALRKAKLELSSSKVLSHPYYWAGFVISGKTNHVIFPKTSKQMPLLGFSFLFVGWIFFVSVRRRRSQRANHD